MLLDSRTIGLVMRFTKELVLAILDLNLKNKNGSRYIGLYNRKDFINRI